MSLRPVYIPGVVGLDTETPPDVRAPNSLSACSNAIIGRNGFLEARHGHLMIQETSEVVPNKLYFNPSFPNSAMKMLWYVYKGVERLVVADDTQFGSVPGRQVRVQSSANFNVNSPNFDLSVLQSVPTNPFTYLRELDKTPNIFVNRDRVYTSSNAGIYYKKADLSGNWNRVENVPAVAQFSVFTRSDFPIPVPENEKWLPLNHAIDIKIVIEEETSEDNQTQRRYTIYESETKSLRLVLPPLNSAQPATSDKSFNFFAPSVSVSVLGSANSAVPFKRFLTVYRTVSYPYISASSVNTLIINPPPLSFYPAAAEVEIPSNSNSSLNIPLIVNDDGIIQFPVLPSSPSQLGIQGKFSPTPPASYITQYKGTSILAGLRLPARFRGAFRTLPSTTETFGLGVSRTGASGASLYLGPDATFQVNFSSIFNSSAPPVNAGVSASSELTFRSTTSSVVRAVGIQSATGASKGNISRIQSYFKSSVALTNTLFPSGTFPTSFSIASTTGTGDSTKFPSSGGIVAVTDESVSGANLKLIFSYTSTSNSTPGSLTFNGCKALTPYTFSTPVAVGNGAFWFIPGNDVKSLPLYASAPELVSSTPTVRPLSLLPNPAFLTAPIAQVAGEFSVSGAYIQPPVLYIGILHKGYAQQLDDAASLLVERINQLAPEYDPPGPIIPIVKAIKLPETGEFEIYSTLPENEVLYFNSLTPGLITPEVGFNPVSVAANPPLVVPSRATSTAEPAGILFPERQYPEVVDEVQFRSPTKIGEVGKNITGLAATSDDLIIFKEEGVYRADFVSGLRPTDTLSIVQIDASTFCQSAGSIQTLGDSVIFLGQKGFMMIGGNGTSPLSLTIENQVKNSLSICRNSGLLGRIRSFKNEFKRLYGCFIPVNPSNTSAGTLYVYDAFTQNWTIWSNKLFAADCTPEGRLISLSYPEAVSSIANRAPALHRDRYSDGQPFSPLDQVELDIPIPLQTAPNPQLYIFTNTVTNSLTISGTNWPAVEATGLAVFPFPGKIAGYYSTGYATMRLGSSFFLCPFVITSAVTANNLVIQFTENIPPVNSFLVNLRVGVPFSATFNSFNGGSPADLKRFSEFKINTEGGVTRIGRQFRTDTKTQLTDSKLWEFTNTSITEFRALIPIEASRGRFLIRHITHDKPLELLSVTGQTIVASSTNSFRTQRDK
jgi:hypothetical protein